MVISTPPDHTEAAEYYFTYIDKVPGGDIVQILEAQASEVRALLQSISAEQSLHRYAPGKWSMRDAVAHVNDTERVFVFRAFWFARGLEAPLPGFDQDVTAVAAAADTRDWNSLIDEFRAIRAASVALYKSLPDDAWARRGVASGNPFSVRALAYCTAGHVAHHLQILRERYLQP